MSNFKHFISTTHNSIHQATNTHNVLHYHKNNTQYSIPRCNYLNSKLSECVISRFFFLGAQEL